MAFLDGVQNFVPAFKGRELAQQSGAQIGAGFARGRALKQQGEYQDRSMDIKEDVMEEKRLEREATLASLEGLKLHVQGGEDVPTDSVGRANHVINRLSQDPSWLANPRTSQAANAMFSSASKILTINLQMEKLKNSSSAAQTQQRLIGQQSKMLEDIAKTGVDGAGAVGGFFVKDSEGNLPAADVGRFGEIAALYKQFVPATSPAGELEGVEVVMPDGSTVQALRNTMGKGYTVVPKKSDSDRAVQEREVDKRIGQLETDARNADNEYTKAIANYNAAAAKIKGKTSDETLIADMNAAKAKVDTWAKRRDEKRAEAARLKSPANTSQPNVTQDEYEKMNSGDLYWWNGKQIPKR